MRWAEKFQHLITGKSNGPKPHISGSLKMEGDFFFHGSGAVSSSLSGRFGSDGTLSVQNEAVLKGPLNARGLQLEGTLHGDVDLQESARLEDGCQLRGDLKAGSLSVREGADFHGSLMIGIR